MDKKAISYGVSPLPAGTYEGVTIAFGSKSSNRVFFKFKDGRIYVSGRRNVMLDSEYGCNDADRRAFAKLAGITVASIKAHMKEVKRLQNMRHAKSEIVSLRVRAIRAGYRLVKVKL